MTDLDTSSRKDASQAPEPGLLDHEYDGIREYDNPMPGWWTSTFWATFVFALGYLLVYHVSGRVPSIAGEYAEQDRVARQIEAQRALKEAVSEESLAKLMADGATMTEAKATFQASCEVCHAQEGRGLIGPNLTDDFWIHGTGKLLEIHEVVRAGVLSKGMPAWDRQLTPTQLRKVVAYVGTLRGRRLAGKPAEGNEVGAQEPASQQSTTAISNAPR